VTVTPTPVDFWFDPACPWAWLTSRWIVNTEQVRPIRTTFRVMSLAVLNEEKITSDETRLRLLGPVRVLTSAAEEHGVEVLRDLYTQIGRRIHQGRQQASPALVGEALAASGLPDRHLVAWESDALDAQVRASHQAAIDLAGYDVGTPIIRVGGDTFFGPVVTPAPEGEAAGRLWDGFRLVGSTPGFFEIKRSRDVQPDLAGP